MAYCQPEPQTFVAQEQSKVLWERNALSGLRLFAARRDAKIKGRDSVPYQKQKTHAAKRRYPRVRLPKGMLVAWQSLDGRGVSRVTTLGLGGLFLDTPDPPPAGTLLKLLFDVPEGEVRARAVVKDSQLGEGMAVAFVDMGYSDRARLNSLLKRLA